MTQSPRLLLSLLVASVCTLASAATCPNIIVILSDDKYNDDADAQMNSREIATKMAARRHHSEKLRTTENHGQLAAIADN